MKKVTLCFLIATSFSLSCRKDPVNPVDCPDVEINSSSTIIIGDTTGMIIHEVDDTVAYFYGTNQPGEPHYYAVRCRDTFDLQFDYWYFDGPGPFNSYGMSLSSQNGVQFRSVQEGYKEYYYDDTTYYGSNPVYMTIHNDLSCFGDSSKTPTLIEDQPIFYEGGETLQLADYYGSDGGLYRPSWLMPNSPNDQGNDTSLVNSEEYERWCSNIDLIQPKYIGIKMVTDGIEKLGWVKLGPDSSPGGNVIVLEIAVQR